jgi:hypothetical protein
MLFSGSLNFILGFIPYLTNLIVAKFLEVNGAPTIFWYHSVFIITFLINVGPAVTYWKYTAIVLDEVTKANR